MNGHDDGVEAHGAGDRSRGARRTAGFRWTSVAGWVLAVLLLAHFVWGHLRAEDGRPKSPLPEGAIRAIAFWVPVAATVAACALGALWAHRAWLRKEKGSLLWTRNAFFAGIGASAVLAVTALDARTFPREWFVSIAALLLAAVTGVFAYASHREVRRSHSGSRTRSSSFEDGND